MQQPIIFNNQSGDDVIRAMQAAPRREPTVVLSRTLVREIRMVLGIAGPSEDTVLLLRAEHRRKPRVASRFFRAVVVVASIVSRAVLVIALAAALGSAIAGG